MFKLFVTTFFENTTTFEAKTSCIHTLTIDFDTQDQADTAYEQLREQDGIRGTKREVVKLYKG